VRTIFPIVALLLVLWHSPCTAEPAEKPSITAPPKSLKLDPFYKKHVNSKGVPIVSSEKVADAALLKVDELVNKMLADRPDIREALIEAGVRFVIIGAKEQTTDITEYSHMKPKQQYELRVKRLDKEFDEKLRQLYENATNKGLWKDTPAAENHKEYWSEGVQSWFDANRQNAKRHNHIDTREELEAYDPNLAELIAEVFRHADRVDWRYRQPDKRSF